MPLGAFSGCPRLILANTLLTQPITTKPRTICPMFAHNLGGHPEKGRGAFPPLCPNEGDGLVCVHRGIYLSAFFISRASRGLAV